jgi:hypothetical protein
MLPLAQRLVRALVAGIAVVALVCGGVGSALDQAGERAAGARRGSSAPGFRGRPTGSRPSAGER